MKLADMTWPEVNQAAAKAVAILPIASIEQHGPHLAVSTDSTMATALAEEVEKQLPRDVILCPTQFYGSSHHHLAFPGTLSISADVFTKVLVELVQSLVRGGFRRVVLLNGHGGNITPGRQALTLLSQELDDSPARPNVVLATYWELAGSAFKGDPPMETPSLTHACEYETSLMLHLMPHRVRKEKALRSSKIAAPNDYVAWELDRPYRGVTMSKRTHFISKHGGSGNPKLASAEKGKHLFAKASAALVDFVSDFKRWPFMDDLRRE